jgi:hypothetical protein
VNGPDEPGPDAAVAAEAIARLVASASDTGIGPVTTSWEPGTPGYDGDIMGRLRDGLRAGTVPGCSHERSDPLLIWFLAPGCPVGCYPCVLGWLVENVSGTPEDDVCDICRQPARIKTERSMIFRVGVTGEQAVTITYFVCLDCEAAEDRT